MKCECQEFLHGLECQHPVQQHVAGGDTLSYTSLCKYERF